MVAPLWQLSISSQQIPKWAYLIWNFAPISGQQISILDPPLTLDFLVRLGLNFHPKEFAGGGDGGVFGHGQKRDYVSHASSQQCATGTTKKDMSLTLITSTVGRVPIYKNRLALSRSKGTKCGLESVSNNKILTAIFF